MIETNRKPRLLTIAAVLLISVALVIINIFLSFQLESTRQIEQSTAASRDQWVKMSKQLENRKVELQSIRQQVRQSSRRIEDLIQSFKIDSAKDAALAAVKKSTHHHVLLLKQNNDMNNPEYWIRVPESGHTMVVEITKMSGANTDKSNEERQAADGDIETLEIPLDPGEVYRLGYRVEQLGCTVSVRLNNQVVFEDNSPDHTCRSTSSTGSHRLTAIEPGISEQSWASTHGDLVQEGYWLQFGGMQYDFYPTQVGQGESFTYRFRIYLKTEGNIYTVKPSYSTRGFDRFLFPSQQSDPTLNRVRQAGETATEK